MEVGEQFSLCWNNFHTNLSNGFQSLLKEEDLVDVTLAAEGKYIKAHKTVLSVCSPFFKELFRVNPCKHPIVILPDVNYEALHSLLQFMYQGQVSVSQEEIPVFMKVAETLKVKGLTEHNTSDPPNGFSSKSSFGDIESSRQDILKRPRPVKKVIGPVQPLRPLGTPSPNATPSTTPPLIQTPPIKRPHLDSTGSEVLPQIQPSSSSQILNPLGQPPPVTSPDPNQALPLIKPKDEPVDPNEEETVSQTGMDEMNLELANMLDTQLSGGEPSPSHQIPTWPAPGEMTPMVASDDSAQPGSGLVIVKSGRGQLVLIHNGHMYTFVGHKDTKSLWICVKKKTLQCKGCLTTRNGQLLSYIGHNHSQIHDVIQRLQVPKPNVNPEIR